MINIRTQLMYFSFISGTQITYIFYSRSGMGLNKYIRSPVKVTILMTVKCHRTDGLSERK